MFVKTRKTLVCWHFTSRDALDEDKLSYIEKQLNGLSNVKTGSFFIVPGVDRDPNTYDLKPDCRTVRYRPGINRTASRKAYMEFLGRLKWSDKIKHLPPPTSYKAFWVFLKDADMPVEVRDDALFSITCTEDAEQMV